MKTIDQERTRDQLKLFERRPIRTSWNVIPLDVRQEVVRLLAKMLVEHRVRGRRVIAGGGEKQ